MYEAADSTLRGLIVDALMGDPASLGFELYYQPVVQFEDNLTVAVEAFARWSHPTVGNISPKLFASVAEPLGLMGIADDLVLERGCADAIALVRAYGRPIDVHVAVSASRLGQRDLEATVARALGRRRMQSCRLVLEINEAAQITDLDAVACSVRNIRKQGARVALNDLGASVNWLSRLYDPPLDVIKLDAAASEVNVETKRVAPMCEVLITLCGNLKLPVIAEGVETEWQARALARLGCTLGQGYLYGPPEPLSRVTAPYPRTTPLRQSIPITRAHTHS